MTDRTFTTEQKTKLTQIINEGMSTMHEIGALQGGLNDTIKAIAEEIEIKPSILKKAIKLAHKAGLTQTNKDHDELNHILDAVGKTL